MSKEKTAKKNNLQSVYLEEVELNIIENPVIVQVRHFEDSSQGFYTERPHLGQTQIKGYLKKKKTQRLHLLFQFQTEQGANNN